MKKVNIVTIAAIIGVTIIETCAVLTGMDGDFLGVAIAALAGLGGYQVGLNTPTPPKE